MNTPLLDLFADARGKFQVFRKLTTRGLKRLDKLQEQIARSNDADIEDVLHFFDTCAVEF